MKPAAPSVSQQPQQPSQSQIHQHLSKFTLIKNFDDPGRRPSGTCQAALLIQGGKKNHKKKISFHCSYFEERREVILHYFSYWSQQVGIIIWWKCPLSLFEGVVRGTNVNANFLKQYLCSCAGSMAITLPPAQPPPPAHGCKPSPYCCHCSASSLLEECFHDKGVFKSSFILKSRAQMAEGICTCHVWVMSNKCA